MHSVVLQDLQAVDHVGTVQMHEGEHCRACLCIRQVLLMAVHVQVPVRACQPPGLRACTTQDTYFLYAAMCSRSMPPSSLSVLVRQTAPRAATCIPGCISNVDGWGEG